MEIVFDNGLRDKIRLQEVSNIPGEVRPMRNVIFYFRADHHDDDPKTLLCQVTPCLYSGSLDKDQDSEVTVVGCRGGEDFFLHILLSLNISKARRR